MATYLENLRTARDKLSEALAKNAGRPNYTVDGQTFDFNGLLDRIAKLDAAIAAAEGPTEFETLGQV